MPASRHLLQRTSWALSQARCDGGRLARRHFSRTALAASEQPVNGGESKEENSSIVRRTAYKNAPVQSPTLSLAPGPIRVIPIHQHFKRPRPLPFIDPVYLRDACSCPLCLDPSTKQKLFQTSDIPQNIEYAEYEELLEKGLRIKWKNDVPGYNETHESFYDYEFLLPIVRRGPRESDAEPIQRERDTWNKAKISEEIKFLDYSEYISSDDVLFEALKQLHRHGLVFIKNIPPTEKAVEEIGGRIGQLRETFYGRTWDVKSVPQAKNIAYTSQFLGLHMDLLYMTDPPGLQLLHCLKNSCSGGASMFTDSFQAVKELRHAANNDDYHILQEAKTTYHYKNAGKHYQHSHPTIVLESKASQLMSHVNWSPPFQAPFGHEDRPLLHPDGRTSRSATVFRRHVEALKKFQDIIEREDNIFEYKMNEGECVIFNNRRVLHARRAFDESSGERWLKGAYLDTDTFKNQYRLLFEKYKHPVPSTATEFGTAKRAFQERGAQPSSEDILEEELDDLDDWITNSVQR